MIQPGTSVGYQYVEDIFYTFPPSKVYYIYYLNHHQHGGHSVQQFNLQILIHIFLYEYNAYSI